MKISISTNSRYKFIDKQLSVGKPILSPLQLYRLKQEGFNQIIDLRHHSNLLKLMEKLLAKLFNIKYKNIIFPTDSNEIPNIQFFHKINQQIVNNNGKTYLHCKHGIHRTSMCVAVYEKEIKKENDLNILSNLFQSFYAKKIGDKNMLNFVLENFVKMLGMNS